MKKSIGTAKDIALKISNNIDNLPISPSKVASKIIDQHNNAKITKASENLEWVKIQQKRLKQNPKENKAYLSWEDLQKQVEIENTLTPDPNWLPIVYKLQDITLTKLTKKIIWKAQKITKGYDDRAIWNLDSHITKHLANTIEELASKTNGYPSDYQSFEDWVSKLNQVALDLRSYDDTQNQQIIQMEKLIEKAATLKDSKKLEELDIELEKLQAEKVKKAQEALIWIADNLPKLWD